MIDVAQIAKNLQLSEENIRISKSDRVISFPQDGHYECSQVEDGSFWFKHRNNCLLAAAKNFPPGGAIFDIGAGNGYVSAAFQQHGIDTVIVEPGIEGARNARAR